MKVPDKDTIRKMEDERKFSHDFHELIGRYCPKAVPSFKIWNTDYNIRRRSELSFFEDFFDWYELTQTPLYQALREGDNDDQE